MVDRGDTTVVQGGQNSYKPIVGLVTSDPELPGGGGGGTATRGERVTGAHGGGWI